jgi:hypothetical protein
MSTPPIRKITDEEIEADIAANRFMHLLHHPEEQDRNGDQTGATQKGATHGPPPAEPPLPLRALTDTESALTTELRENDESIGQAKIRRITPWTKTAGQIHKE